MFEKQRTIDPVERSVFQLHETLRSNKPDKDPKSYLSTKIRIRQWLKKKKILLYLEHLTFK